MGGRVVLLKRMPADLVSWWSDRGLDRTGQGLGWDGLVGERVSELGGGSWCCCRDDLAWTWVMGGLGLGVQR